MGGASMGELGGAQKYLYWANRRILRWLEDSDIKIPESSQWKVKTPNFGNVIPTVEISRDGGRTTKTELANIFQRSFGQRIVSDLSSLAPIEFASGVSPVTFGEFVSPDGTPQRALIYASVSVECGDPVAVCLFGSLENYADFVIEASARRGLGGWTASSAGDIERFLSTGKFENGVCCDSREDIAHAAVSVCCNQGGTGVSPDKRKGYNRQFTYGETRGISEWCAEIYLDVDFSEKGTPAHGHSRVLVGAPLWIRTPTLRSVYLYSDYTRNELEEIGKKPAVGDNLSYSGRLKKAVRALRGFEE